MADTRLTRTLSGEVTSDLLDELSEAVTVMDLDSGDVLYANREAKELHEDGLVGRTYFDLIPDQSQDAAHRRLALLQQGFNAGYVRRTICLPDDRELETLSQASVTLFEGRLCVLTVWRRATQGSPTALWDRFSALEQTLESFETDVSSSTAVTGEVLTAVMVRLATHLESVTSTALELCRLLGVHELASPPCVETSPRR